MNKISVSELVQHIFMSGSLTSEYFQNADALEGIMAHQHVQAKYEEDDEKEVFIEHSFSDFKMLLSGRMDGVLQTDELVIDEIKSTRENIFADDFNYRKQHFAQVMLYGYMYCLNHDLSKIKLRLNYVSIADYKTKYFYFDKTLKELKEFFEDAIKEYHAFKEMVDLHKKEFRASIKELEFPFGDYRSGQRDLMRANYLTIKADEICYAIAPTGVGKTMAFLYSGLKAIDKDNQILFYLTAKNSGKTVAKKSFKILSESGLKAKCLELTAKEKVCFKEGVKCDPEYCEYARGFFDRLKDAAKDLFINEDVLTSTVVSDYAQKHTVCPFEYSLYMGYFSDVITGDYNYAFDPKIHLKRFFDDGFYKPILLVDEAHNMVDRSVKMFSSELSLSKIKEIKKAIKDVKGKPVKVVKEIIETFEKYRDKVEDEFYYFKEKDKEFMSLILNLHRRLKELLMKNPQFPTRDQVVDGFFAINDFHMIFEFYNDSYITLVKTFGKDVTITLNCLDASQFILDTIYEKCKSASFFSASFEPIDYFKSLITMSEGKVIKIPSPFPQENLNLIMQTNISTKYRDRENSIESIIESIECLVDSKVGNYIVFFPSYKYMNMVLEKLDREYEIITQKPKLNDLEKEEIISRFSTIKEVSQVGFFVLGGVFSEGIDLIGDMLSGVIVVGVGLPMFNKYNNLLKDYYQHKYNNGYDYAYTFKGFNKVIQAVGRLIRSETDRGNVILIDERFTNYKYLPLVRTVWNHQKVVNSTDELLNEVHWFIHND